MTVTSLELSRELHEVSGWRKDDLAGYWWLKSFTRNGEEWKVRQVWEDKVVGKYDVPAYDLGYLLRKLPNNITLERYESTIWRAEHDDYGPSHEIRVEADTPEDAAAKLAIELFKQGILVK